MKVCVVATNYNNSKYTISLYESLLKAKGIDFQLVVVDNNSSDKELEILRNLDKDSRVRIIYSKKNVGYFKGLNIGISSIEDKEKKTFDIWLVGNNDITVPDNFILSLKSKYDFLKKYPVVSPNIVTLDGIHQNPHVINSISCFREIIYNIYHSRHFLAKIIIWLAKLTKRLTDRSDERFHQHAQEIYQGYGACYILTPIFFRYFDSLWSPTFLMYEEFFLSKQLSDKGFKIFYEPEIIVFHACKGATGSLPSLTKWEFSRESHNEYRKYVGIWGKKDS